MTKGLLVYVLNFHFSFYCFRWTFHLYDLNGDGVITKDEMEDVTASVDNHDFCGTGTWTFFCPGLPADGGQHRVGGAQPGWKLSQSLNLKPIWHFQVVKKVDTVFKVCESDSHHTNWKRNSKERFSKFRSLTEMAMGRWAWKVSSTPAQETRL